MDVFETTAKKEVCQAKKDEKMYGVRFLKKKNEDKEKKSISGGWFSSNKSTKGDNETIILPIGTKLEKWDEEGYPTIEDHYDGVDI